MSSGTLSRGLLHSLHVTKFVVVISLFSMVPLEFICLGTPGTISWGGMLDFAFDASYMLMGNWWTGVFPGVAILVLTASLYVFIGALEEALRRMTTPTTLAREVPISPSFSSPQAP